MSPHSNSVTFCILRTSSMHIGIFLASFNTKQAGNTDEFVPVNGAYDGVLQNISYQLEINH